LLILSDAPDFFQESRADAFWRVVLSRPEEDRIVDQKDKALAKKNEKASQTLMAA